ncbi:hypothetical protein ACUN9Y_18300 [Halomonas sp. V046]|uniref:hypothetical protein n=1 Tax=Halomonas sp. V046 TaxID=3459611 RepID=UPI00404491EB
MKQSVYYLSSLDSIVFSKTRRCNFIKKFFFDTGKECVLANIDPPVIGQTFGFSEDISNIILSGRHEGENIFNIKNFPFFVFVAKLNCSPEKLVSGINKDDLHILAWGEIYRTFDDAENHAFD